MGRSFAVKCLGYCFALVLAQVALVALLLESLQVQQNLSVLDVYRCEQAVRQRLLQDQLFREVFRPALADLARGRIGLQDAAVRVRIAAELFAPDYLRNVQRTEAGANLHEKVARNLAGHLRMEQMCRAGLLPRVQELEEELQKRFGRGSH